MNVDVLRSTEQPERLVCQAARGDYYGGYVGETDYHDLMESVNFGDTHIERALSYTQRTDNSDYYPSPDDVRDNGNTYVLNEAATISFIEKQAYRGHWGPWEHPSITFSVEGMSRVTMAQITRHRHMSFDVQSMRYVNFEDADVTVPRSLTDPDHFSRKDGEVPLSEERQSEWERRYEEYVNNCVELYENMVEDGVPEEDARYILPLGTKVNVTFSGNARTMLHVLNLRARANAQWEVRDLSEKITDHLKDWIPYTANWWEKNGPVQISP